MRNNMKKIFYIVIYSLVFCTICHANDYLWHLMDIVQSSPEDRSGNQKWTLRSLKDVKDGRFKNDFEKQDEYLSTLEKLGTRYISISFFYDFARSIETYLILKEDIKNIPNELFEWQVEYNDSVFEQLEFYALHAANKAVFTSDFCGMDPLSFQLLRVFDGKQVYSSLFISPSEVLSGKNSKVSQENFNAAYAFCSMVIYEYLNNASSVLFRKIFTDDNFLRFHNNIKPISSDK